MRNIADAVSVQRSRDHASREVVIATELPECHAERDIIRGHGISDVSAGYFVSDVAPCLSSLLVVDAAVDTAFACQNSTDSEQDTVLTVGISACRDNSACILQGRW